MIQFVVNDSGLVVAAKAQYAWDGDNIEARNEAGDLREVILNVPGFTIHSTEAFPDAWTPNRYQYVNGSFVDLTNENAFAVIREALDKNPSWQSLSDAAVASNLNEVVATRGLELVDFFTLLVQHGTNPDNLADIWKYDGFRQGLEKALLAGKSNNVRAYVATAPWVLEEATKAAAEAALAVAEMTVGDTIAQEMGLDLGYTFTESDVSVSR